MGSHRPTSFCLNHPPPSSLRFSSLRVPSQWCVECHRGLRDPVVVEGRAALPLANLLKLSVSDAKGDQEKWVQCEAPNCGRWQHQVCALFNHRRHGTGERARGRYYCCPHCVLAQLDQGVQLSRPRMRRAAELRQVGVGCVLRLIDGVWCVGCGVWCVVCGEWGVRCGVVYSVW